jgi:hypothetical protein
MFFHAMRAAGLVAASAVVALAGARQASLQGVETGHFITNPGTQGATVITDDFAEGIAPRLGKYTLIAREEINLQTGDVSDGAFVITAADGGTIRGTYSGTAAFGATSASWIANGSIAGGTGRFTGATGTIHLDGSSDLRTCETVGALSVCGFTETTAIKLVLP